MLFTRTDVMWVKFGKYHDFVLVGKDTIATASGIYIYFLDWRTKERRIERFDGQECEDGASCVAGHSVVPVFSVVERRANPRISIYAYPKMTKISCCAGSKEANGYLCCSFAGTEYLLGQTTFPNFRIILWHWRTGEKATAIDTTITDVDRQILACSPSSHQIGQFAPNSGKLATYRLLACSKILLLVPVVLGKKPTERKLVSFSWSTDGNLFLCDNAGETWSIDLDATESSRVCETITDFLNDENRKSSTPMIIAHRGGVLVATPGSKNKARATFYRKSSIARNAWTNVWTISLPSLPARMECHPRGDGVLIHGINGDILEIIWSSRDHVPRLEFLHTDGVEYIALSPMSLQGRCFAALDRYHRLVVFETSTGNIVSSKLPLKHHGEVLRVNWHPTLSIIATCSVTGNCLLINAPATSSPKILKCFHLQKEPLNITKFSEGGETLGVGAKELGRIFLLTVNLSKIKVAGLLTLEKKIADFLIYEDRKSNSLKVLILVTKPNQNFGKKILVYSCKITDNLQVDVYHQMELLYPFTSLFSMGGNKFEIIGVPHLSKQLHRMEIRNDFKELILVEALPSLHQLRNFEIYVSTRDSQRIVTFGYDGLVILRDGSEPRKILAIFAAHHRSEEGIKQAIIVGETVVTLGRNGDIVANKLRLLEGDDQIGNLTPQSLDDTRKEDEIEEKEKIKEGETWLESMILERSRVEMEQALPLRASISKDLESLRSKVKSLLDSNEKELPIAQLPVCSFDLDKKAREHAITAASVERDRMCQNLEEQLTHQGQVISHLREKFWDSLTVHPCAIVSIFGKIKVTNYPLTLRTPNEVDFETWSRFSLETREIVTRFEADCAENSTKRSTIGLGDFSSGYVDVLETNAIIMSRERELKVRFNELFDETRTAKIKEIERTGKRVERLRYCINELKEIFGIDTSADIMEVPKLQWGESPEDTVTVREEELATFFQVPRTISNSVASAGSENSTRNIDTDFREKTLEKIMDGLLEVRWEDEARRKIPMPECITTKDPSKYTEEDRRTIEAYETKLQAQRIQREKYKSMLEAEIAQIKEKISNGIIAFDVELKNLAMKKIVTERSILREKLIRVQKVLRHRRIRKKNLEISRIAQQELLSATNEARKISEETDVFEAATIELRARYESLCKREKLLEGKFRAEFADLKQPMVEHLFRHYKRRPRTVLDSCTSVTFLTELAKCLLSREKSEILPRECLEFLRAMETLDAIPDGLPAQIEPVQWQNMCRLRRIKVETETKVRICVVEVAEAEQSLSYYRKASSIGRGRANRVKEAIRDHERSLIDSQDDQEIGLVLKTGQIEVDLEGSPVDCAKATLIPRGELLRVNEAIARAGERKLTALRLVMDLRKKILLEEWQHACMKMMMEDLHERLEDTRGAKITRNIRECVARYPDGRLPENEAEIVARNIRAGREKFEETMEREQIRLKKIAVETGLWRRRNDTLVGEVGRVQREAKMRQEETRDPSISINVNFRRKRLAAITKRLNMKKRVRENFEDLVTLRARLEVLKLRTYPTLKFRF